MDEQFGKFVEVIQKLYINIPLLDALQLPTYAKYLRDILNNKRPWPTTKVIKLMEECSAVILNTSLVKKDLGCPTIDCSIGNQIFENACNTLVLRIAFNTCISWAQASPKHSRAWAYEISSYSYILSHVMLVLYMYMLVIMCDQCKRWLWGHKNTLDTSRIENGTMFVFMTGQICF